MSIALLALSISGTHIYLHPIHKTSSNSFPKRPYDKPCLLFQGISATPAAAASHTMAAASLTMAAAATANVRELEGKKHDLLRAVQETERGFFASADQRSSIEEALVNVEELGAGSQLDLAVLDGTWRLNYTSAIDVLVLFEAAARLPFFQVGQIFQKFECRDRTNGGIVRNVVRWSVANLLEEQEGATLLVTAKFSVLTKRNIYLQFDEVAVENIKISEELQALIAPAVLPRSFLSLQILQFLRTFRVQVPLSGPDKRSPGGLYYLSYLDRDMLIGRAIEGGGVFVFTRAQPLVFECS